MTDIMDDKMKSPCKYCIMLPERGHMSCCHSIDVKQQRDRYREAGAVLLRAIYESGIAYNDPEIASALAVFADE